MDSLADHAGDVFLTRPRLAHRRTAARKNYHLAAPGSNRLAGGRGERRATDLLMRANLHLCDNVPEPVSIGAALRLPRSGAHAAPGGPDPRRAIAECAPVTIAVIGRAGRIRVSNASDNSLRATYRLDAKAFPGRPWLPGHNAAQLKREQQDGPRISGALYRAPNRAPRPAEPGWDFEESEANSEAYWGIVQW
jgi:hypothetical protein